MKIERAKVKDAPSLHEIINHFAKKGDMLPRSLSEIYENIRDFFVVRDGEEIVGAVALHIIWGDLAEIKSLSVREEYQGRGIGKSLVRACLEEAKKLGIPRVFCLTNNPSFFEKLGFKEIDVMELPRKIWGECQRCPKFPHCDEVAMTRDIV